MGSTLATLRTKHNSNIAEMGDQIDSLNKQKAKVEKERNAVAQELEEATHVLQGDQAEKSTLEKNGKLISASINDSQIRLEELQRALHEADGAKRKLMVENCDLTHHLDEGERMAAQLSKDKTSLTTQLEDAKRLADAETRERINLLGKMRNLEHELEVMKEHLDEEFDAKQEVERQLSKAFADIQLWKTRYETEGVARMEEIDRDKAKVAMRLSEAEDTIFSLQEKIGILEKSKVRLAAELDDLTSECERHTTNAGIIEKRGRNFDKIINEWKCKADDLTNEIGASQSECRNYSSEYFRIKSANEEILEHLDTVKRENKNLAEEIKDLLDQLGEGGRSIHELDKQRRKLEVEKEELQAGLEEAEAALEQEENKVLRAQLEMSQVRQEIDRRIQEKEEEFDHSRKNHQRAMDSMQASLEAESRAKAEALRIKKKLESDINELEIALDHANKANSEAHKSIKRYQAQLRDTEGLLESETSQKIEITEKAGLAERKANALQGELEESRALLDSADRSKKQTDMELTEARSAVNDMTTINSKAASDKRHLESAIHTMHAEIDDMLRGAKGSEDKAKKEMVDAARLADELRAEQDHCAVQEKAKRALTSQLGELEGRLADANEAAAKGGRNAMAKLESRIREMEIELGSVQSKTSDAYKAFQKAERRIKELQFQQDEDKKNQDSMSELANKLQMKIKTYKKQIEEAEEIAALNLAKFRKAQQELEETEDRNKMAEAQLAARSF